MSYLFLFIVQSLHNIDSLALMNVSVDFDELSICVLNGLGSASSNISHALLLGVEGGISCQKQRKTKKKSQQNPPKYPLEHQIRFYTKERVLPTPAIAVELPAITIACNCGQFAHNSGELKIPQISLLHVVVGYSLAVTGDWPQLRAIGSKKKQEKCSAV